MQTIKYEVDSPSMIDDIHGEGGDCLTLCPNGLSPKVASVSCRQCDNFVSWNNKEIVCKYPSTSDNNDCTATAQEPSPKLCPNCQRAEMVDYATNRYCPACGQSLS